MEFDKYDHLNIANTAVFLSPQCVILGESNLLNSAEISHIYVCTYLDFGSKSSLTLEI
jgi:hypothetical protein